MFWNTHSFTNHSYCVTLTPVNNSFSHSVRVWRRWWSSTSSTSSPWRSFVIMLRTNDLRTDIFGTVRSVQVGLWLTILVKMSIYGVVEIEYPLTDERTRNLSYLPTIGISLLVSSSRTLFFEEEVGDERNVHLWISNRSCRMVSVDISTGGGL